MNRKLLVTLLLFAISGGSAPCGENECEPQAVALVAKHQIERMKLGKKQLVCVSLPNYKDPSADFLKKINEQRLTLSPGSVCREPPKGIVILIIQCRKVSEQAVELRLEVDDMNLDSAHVASRLRTATYRIRVNGDQWKIDSYESTEK